MRSLRLGNYLLLVEYTGRLFRAGKASISGELAGVFTRLGIDAESWSAADGEAEGWSVAGPVLCREPNPLARGGRTAGSTSPGKPGRLPGPSLRSMRDERLDSLPLRDAAFTFRFDLELLDSNASQRVPIPVSPRT